jgi:hypothetical protein
MTLSPVSMTALALACFMIAASAAQAAPAREKTAAVHQKKAVRAPQPKAPAARSDESWMDRASNPSNSGGGGGAGY